MPKPLCLLPPVTCTYNSRRLTTDAFCAANRSCIDRVFRDCRFHETRRAERRPGCRCRLERPVDLGQSTLQNHAFTEENTYQKPSSPGLTLNLV